MTEISELSSASTHNRVAKMNGAGNEIVVVDLRGGHSGITAAQARAIHQKPGLAFDQLMVLSAPRRVDTAAFVRIYNNDGSEAGACGNGTRCVAYFLMRDSERRDLKLETAAGVLDCRRESEFTFRVDMGEPRLGWSEIPLSDPVADTRFTPVRIDHPEAAGLRQASMVNMGNPHAIFWVEDVAAYDLKTIGPLFENHPIFPEKANISLAEVAARDSLRLRVWERGVGLTRACGSAACAALVAAVREDLADRKALIRLPGGDLTIEWRRQDNRVLMTGPVALENETSLDLS